MNSKALFSAITLLLCINWTLSADVCPPAADIAPCTCHIESFTIDGRFMPAIKCNGLSVKDLKLIFGLKFVTEDRSPIQFSSLYINGTDIQVIPSGTFGDAFFHSIFFGNNLKLTHISPDAFKKGDHELNHLQNLDIYNNPLLGATDLADLFKLIDHLQPKHVLDLTQTGITEIPDNAFALNQHIRNIYIQHNPQLKRVGKYAFSFLPQITDITLQSNPLLSVIDAHAFEFSSIFSVQLDLAFNQLTEASFNPLAFGTAGKGPQEVLLYANQMKSVPEAVFRQHMGGENGIHRLQLHQNPIVCDCKTKWLLDDNLSTRVPTVNCANLESRNLFTIEPLELALKC